MTGSSNGSAYPGETDAEPHGVAVNEYAPNRLRPCFGSSGHFEHRCRQLPQTVVAFYGGLDAACRKLCRAVLPVPPAGKTPCWFSRTRWLIEVQTAYHLRYPTVRDQLVKRTGSGLSLRALIDVARAMANAADHSTGRGSRLAVETITERTGIHERLVQRSRTLLALLDCGTEIQRGRHRTLVELRQRPRWDRSRGWTSVWHLHPSRTAETPAVKREVTPPRQWSLKTLSLRKKNSLDTRAVEKPTQRPRVSVEQLRGVALAARWQRHPDAPQWVADVPLRDLGRALAPFADSQWTPGDLSAAVTTHGPVIGRAIAPDRPCSWLRWLSQQVDLLRPTSAEIAAATAHQAEESRRRRAEHAAARAAGLAALNGPGRAAALAAVGLSAQTR